MIEKILAPDQWANRAKLQWTPIGRVNAVSAHGQTKKTRWTSEHIIRRGLAPNNVLTTYPPVV
jgi:hypothetical protein